MFGNDPEISLKALSHQQRWLASETMLKFASRRAFPDAYFSQRHACHDESSWGGKRESVQPTQAADDRMQSPEWCREMGMSKREKQTEPREEANLHVLIAWTLVGLPLAWGLLETLRDALFLLQ
jgi:hypothetical protein